MSDVHEGDRIIAQDAAGRWLRAVALSDVEPTHRDGRKIHRFPVVWIQTRTRPKFDPIPWPAEYVRPVEAGDGDWLGPELIEEELP